MAALKQLHDRNRLLNDLQALETRAHNLGCHVTGHALNRAKNALGWEIAGDVEQAGIAAIKESVDAADRQ